MSAYEMCFNFLAVRSTQEILSGHNNMIASSQLILHISGQGLGVMYMCLVHFIES